jgi:hypothetical protein
VLLGAILPAAASAKDYQVPPGSGQAFADALAQAQANPGPDRILLGSGFYTAPVATGFSYNDPGDPVEIAGAGRNGAGASVINGQLGGSGQTLFLRGGTGTQVHDVRVDLPVNAALSTYGLATDGVVRRVSVMAKEAQQTNGVTGVALFGGTLADAIVDVGANNTVGVLMGDEGGTLRDSSVSGKIAVSAPYGALIERSRLAGATHGVTIQRNQTTIRSSEIVVSDPTGAGIGAYAGSGADDAVVVDGTTILGPGTANSKGILAGNGYNPAAQVDVTLTNSLVRGFGNPLRATGGAPGSVHIAASWSDYAAGSSGDASAGISITEFHISNVGDAGFAGPGDHHLVKGSPLVDAGDPAAQQGLDLASNPLVADGNADGMARRDIGAYELPGPAQGEQPPEGGQGGDTTAPVLSGFASTKKSFAKRTRFRFTLTEAARMRIGVQRVIGTGTRTRYRAVATITRAGAAGRNSTAFSRKVGRRVLRPGRYRAVARATDAAGNRSAFRRAAFRITR